MLPHHLSPSAISFSRTTFSVSSQRNFGIPAMQHRGLHPLGQTNRFNRSADRAPAALYFEGSRFVVTLLTPAVVASAGNSKIPLGRNRECCFGEKEIAEGERLVG